MSRSRAGASPRRVRRPQTIGFGLPFHVVPQVPHGTAEQDQAEGGGAVADHFQGFHQGRLGDVGSQAGPCECQAYDDSQQGTAEEDAHVQGCRDLRQ